MVKVILELAITIIWIVTVSYVQDVQGCGWIGASNPENLDTSEDTFTTTGIQLKLTGYSLSGCTCGIVTRWKFHARKNGTVIFYTLNGNVVRGSTSIHVPPLSLDNFFEIPLSSKMWVPIRDSDTLGFVTEENPMITFSTSTGTSSYDRSTGKTEVPVGSSITPSGSVFSNRGYALAALVETAHAPMFLNLPLRITHYTHQTGAVLVTVSATDLDPFDVDDLVYAKDSGDGAFVFNTATRTLTYNAERSEGTYHVRITVTDGCHGAVTGTVTILLVNEKPKFTNLPASTTIPEAQTAAQTIYTISTSDNDTVTCSVNSVNPTTGSFSVNGNNEIVQAPTTFNHDTARYYDLLISCNDGDNDVFANFVVDIVRNEPPVFDPGSGYLPASVATDRTGSGTIYTLAATDAEGDAITFAKTGCTPTCTGITVDSGGTVRKTGTLNVGTYDVSITATDSRRTTGPYYLSVLVSETPFTFNDVPTFTNLPANKHVMENTAAGTYLFTLMYTDQNPSDTITLTKGVVTGGFDTYFSFDTASGQISVLAPFNYDSGVSTMTADFTVSDGTDSSTATFTVTPVNVNEAPTIAIATPALTRDEGVRDDVFPSPGINVTDPDAGDTFTYNLDCGADSKYFYINNADKQIYFSREYNMDAGLSGTATCNVTVYDAGRLSDSGTITLTVTNINDHYPRFPKNKYLFLVSNEAPFFQRVANLAASDYDSNAFGSANGLLLYSFSPTTAGNFFQIDASGVLYVRAVSSFSKGDFYTFQVIATDSGSFTGTCTVEVIFPAVEIVTVTTTERSYSFEEDHLNHVWILLLAGCGFTLIILITCMVWKDPVVHEYVTFKMFRISDLCRKKPKEPKRTVGKLTLTINNKTLENDPDNALPWELLAKDADVPETNEIQELIEKRKERTDRDYKSFQGLPVFEKGKGARPESPAVHSFVGNNRQESPKYDSFKTTNTTNHDQERADSQSGQWGDPHERRVYNAGGNTDLSATEEVTMARADIHAVPEDIKEWEEEN